MKATPQATAYSYLRFSNPSQAAGDSVRRQDALRDAWLAKSGAKLDTSLTFQDKGVSGFTGAHRQNPDRHGLAAFLELVRRERVLRGSFLIIENLDRLSREHIQPALLLVLNLLQAGIRIVQLSPVEMVFDDRSDAMQVMMMVMELSRGHSESAMKSKRVGAAWAAKRVKAREKGKVLSRACPAWIAVEGEGDQARYTLIPQRAAVVRRIFRLAAEGQGTRRIVKALTDESVPPFGRTPWNISYLQMILGNRSVFGEFTPRTGRGGTRQRKPDGPPIPGYYPAAVTEAEFYAAQQAIRSRRGKGGGRPAKKLVNLFSGLLHDARTGGRMHLRQYSRGNGQLAYYVAPYGGVAHANAHVSFPLAIFERAVLTCLKEVDPRDILPRQGGGADRVLTLSGRRTDIEGRIEKIKAQLIDGGDDLASLVDVLRTLEGKLTAVTEELQAAQREAASPLIEAWGEARSLLDVLDTAPDPDAARTRLRGALQRVVDSIWCLFLPGRGDRVGAVQIRFAASKERRDYLILFRPAKAGARRRAADWWVRSLADVAKPGDLDLRKRSDAKKLEAALSAVDLAALDRSEA